MRGWFGPKAPARVPTDTVAPLRYWDDTVVVKSLVVYSLARYDAALDPEKLRSSLEKLCSLDGWRKLGARLRKNVRQKETPLLFPSSRNPGWGIFFEFLFSNSMSDRPGGR